MIIMTLWYAEVWMGCVVSWLIAAECRATIMYCLYVCYGHGVRDGDVLAQNLCVV